MSLLDMLSGELTSRLVVYKLLIRQTCGLQAADKANLWSTSC